MKIIELGKVKSYNIRCHQCMSLIEFIESEERYSFTPDSYFGECEDWHIVCPLCGAKIPTRSIMYKGYFDWRKKVYEQRD